MFEVYMFSLLAAFVLAGLAYVSGDDDDRHK